MNVPPDAQAEREFRQALTLHQQARLGEAAAAYRRVLERQPRHMHALNFLAAIAFEGNDFARTLALTGQALEVDLRQPGAHLLQGHALVRLARPEAAIVSYERAVVLQPDLLAAHLALGNTLDQLGRHAPAVRSFGRVLALDPAHVQALNNRGNALRSLLRFEAAVADYDRAIELCAPLPEPHFNRGLALHELRRLDEALASFDRAISLRPGYAAAHFARGNVLKDARQLTAALASYDQAIAAQSGFAEAFCNRGNVLGELERLDEALASYATALALAPGRADTHCNAGKLLCELGRDAEALASLDRALALAPGHATARFTRAFVYLVCGDLARGFREFEWRWEDPHCVTRLEKRTFAQPQWQGEECLEGKTILVYCEQGLGDTLQFCRYLPLLAARGATVIVEAPQPLHGLLQVSGGVASCLLRGETIPPFDCHCPLLSLPLAFKTALATIPAAVPYLRARAERVGFWKEKLGERTRPRVGLVWSGGLRPDQPELWSVNHRRNIPLALLAPLQHPGIEFFSLQKGQPAEGELAALLERGWTGPPMVDVTRELTDFEETAALIAQLDLVIAVDTSTAHLAAALGKRVWLLNRFDTCWRWLRERSDSPWYPTLRLYRQRRRGDWVEVVQRVRADLESFAAGAASTGRT